MKKVKIIVLSVLGVLIAAVLAVGIWQKDNVISFVNSLRYSDTEIADKLDDNGKKLQKIVDETEYIDIRGGLTEEEENALKNNEITQDDAIKLVRGETTLEQIKSGENSETVDDVKTEASAPVQNPNNEVGKSDGTPSKEEIMKDNVSNIIAQLYVVKSDFINKLHEVGSKAYETYKANGSDKSTLTSIADSYAGEIGGLESECDAKVDELLVQLKTELEKGGGDLSLISQVKDYYYKEKSLTKSYYINKYMK